MKESLWGYWITLLGIVVATVMILLQNYTTTHQQDYYLVREISYAAMYDSIDFGYYKKYGDLKIVKEKFVENFIRRFAESATINKNYKVNFYSIYEIPPAVSLEVKTNTGGYFIDDEYVDAGINNRISAILEVKEETKVTAKEELLESNNTEEKGIFKTTVHSATYTKENESLIRITHNLKRPTDAQAFVGGSYIDITESEYKIKLVGVKFLKNIDSVGEINDYKSNYENTFGITMPDEACIKCDSNHYGSVIKPDFKISGNQVTWSTIRSNGCTTPFTGSLLDLSDSVKRCAYGIVYEAIWEYTKK